MSHKKFTATIVLIGALAVTGTALASSGETANVKLPRGYLQINPVTCKFVHPEKDTKTGPSWTDLRTYVLSEDARHDVKMNCVANRKPPTLQYRTAYATGTGLRVTATCPAGYYVTGGGSHSETAGSYEEGNDAWTVVRDHLSPRVLDVTAICISLAP